ncbi:MAG: type II toxin-antitoxin system RelE/ParE family toxin [Alphaproteobacteria bacterium]|jgi:plasmid stabilization system protein ParE|nr:type II toxin-antitoxin system RelE/ParE family toxin [Alphaproteobacteria bacterium]
MKKYDVYLMPDAIKDLEGIYGYITDKSGFPERAWAYVEKLQQKCRELETAPLRGQQRDDLMHNLRIVPIDKKAVAAFLVDEEKRAVLVLNIFYGGRDYEALMMTPPKVPSK